MACFLRNLGRPRSRDRLDVAIWLLAGSTVAFALLTAWLFRGWADRWWPATVLLFGPRWVLLLPFVPLIGLAAWRDRALLVPLGAAMMILLTTVVGVRLGLRGALESQGDGDLVVVSFNARGGDGLIHPAAELLDLWSADVAGIQECGGELRRELLALEGWAVRSDSSLCLASRLPILGTAVMERDVLESVGGSGLVASHAIDGPDGPFHVTNVHLETPRAGLELIRAGRVREGVRVLRQKSLLREIELRRARRWAEEAGSPGIALGDFNTPPESRSFREEWHGWTNAFSVAGTGIGGTRLNGWIRARIDHVLVDERWSVVDAWVGTDVGSDHLPILARVRLR